MKEASSFVFLLLKIVLNHTCDHDSGQARHWLTAENHAPDMSEVLGLDTVVEEHLAGVEDAAQTDSVHNDGENIPDHDDD